jgi:N-acetylglucosamine malate deacetylase 1
MIRKIYRMFKKLMIARPSKRLYKFMITDWTKLTDLKASSMVLETKRFNRNLQPLKLENPDAKRILVIAPHPDDDVLGAGGTLIKAKEIGADIHVVYVTNGLAEKEELIREETLSVCDQLGTTPHFLNCKARTIPDEDPEVNKQLYDLILKVDPEVIFISFMLDDHDDHRRVNQLLMAALKGQAKQKAEIWAYQIYSSIIPNVVVDITDQVEQKRQLINTWKSVGKLGDLAHYILGINASNCRYMQTEATVWGETFFVVPLDEYLDLCKIYFEDPDNKSYYFPAYQ